MQKLIWQNSEGNRIDLTTVPYGVTEWEGFANTSLNIQSQQVPFQDGAVFLDALMEQREISVTLAMQDNNNLEARYRMRRELIHALNPKLGEGYLIYKNDFIEKRIKCVPQIPLFETHNSNDSGTPKASLTWNACEPYWEDIEANKKTLNVGVIEAVENEGDIPTEMEIDLFITNSKNPKIENLTTGKSIQLDGTFDENINININMGKKTITTEKMALDYTNPYRPEKLYYSDRFNLYILINNQGTCVLTSKDGKRWKYITETNSSGYVGGYTDVFCNNNMIFVFGSKCFRTIDGENWDSVEINENIKKVCFSKTLNKYYGIKDIYSDGIYESTDIINWTKIKSGEFYDICCSDGLICAVNGGIQTSADGENWNIIEVDGSYEKVIYTKEANLFMAVGFSSELVKGCIATSSDGINWTEQFLGEKKFTSVGYLSGTRTYFITDEWDRVIKSNNTINWEDVNFDFEITRVGQISIANYAIFLSYYGVDYNQYILVKSTDGEHWNRFIDGHSMLKIAYSDKLGVYCGYRGEQYGGLAYIYYSYDCVNWFETFSVEAWYGYTDISYCEKIGKFLAIAYGGALFTSADGINWESLDVELSFGAEIMHICSSEKLGCFLVATNNINYHEIALSYDGINFTEYDVEYNNDFGGFINNIVFSEKLGCFCGKVKIEPYGGGISKYGVAISNNGINWILKDYGTADSLGYICKSENLGLFLSVGHNISTSTDGLNWVVVKELENNEVLECATYSEELGLFCAVGLRKILISSDGINWKNRREENKEIYLDFVTFVKKLDAFFISFETSGIGVIITSTKSKSNIISSLNADSDMSLSLIMGKNDILLTQESGGLSGRISYRQKYIGV